MKTQMPYIYDDGGRLEAGGHKGKAGDCVARSLAIASGKPYNDIYAFLALGNADQRRSKRQNRAHGIVTADKGIQTKRKWFKDYMTSLGFTWVPTMGIGTGCQVHLVAGELPMGRLVVNVSKHLVAVIDGTIHDTFNPSRRGTRCVYGYWYQAEAITNE